MFHTLSGHLNHAWSTLRAIGSPHTAPLNDVRPLPLEVWRCIQRETDTKTFVATCGVNRALRDLPTAADFRPQLTNYR